MMISAPDQGMIRGSWTWSLDQVLEINPTVLNMKINIHIAPANMVYIVTHIMRAYLIKLEVSIITLTKISNLEL